MDNISPSKPLQLLVKNIANNQPRYLYQIKQYIKELKNCTLPPQHHYAEILLKDIAWLQQQEQQCLAENIIVLLPEYLLAYVITINEFSETLGKCKLNITPTKASGRLTDKILHLEKRAQTRKYTHILGIDDKLRKKTFNKMYPNTKDKMILGEGAHQDESMGWIITIISKYIQQITNTQLFQEILDAFVATGDICKYFTDALLNDSEFELLCQRIISGKMTIILTGSTGHSFPIALYKGFLIISDNGEKENNIVADEEKTHLGTSIYKLTDNHETIIENLHSLLEASVSCKDLHSTYHGISKLVDNTPPILNIKQKKQKYGTCTFVNQKTLVQGLLLIQYAHMKVTQNLCVLDILKTDQEIHIQSYIDYKSFTTFLRQQALLELFSIANNNSPTLSYNAIESLLAFTEKYKHRLDYLKKQQIVKEIDQRIITFLIQTANSQIPKSNNLHLCLLSTEAKRTLDIAKVQYENLSSHLKLQP